MNPAGNSFRYFRTELLSFPSSKLLHSHGLSYWVEGSAADCNMKFAPAHKVYCVSTRYSSCVPRVRPWHRLCDDTEQEVTTMAIDMTAQLAPMMWGMVVLMVVSTLSLLLSHE